MKSSHFFGSRLPQSASLPGKPSRAVPADFRDTDALAAREAARAVERGERLAQLHLPERDVPQLQVLAPRARVELVRDDDHHAERERRARGRGRKSTGHELHPLPSTSGYKPRTEKKLLIEKYDFFDILD